MSQTLGKDLDILLSEGRKETFIRYKMRWFSCREKNQEIRQGANYSGEILNTD
jgi:hypothetical protein